MSSAIYVSESGNSKINGSRKVDATYASIEATCPKTCPFKGEGCYAQTGYVAITTHRLDKRAGDSTAYQVAKEEADAINNSYNGGPVPSGRDLRIHVSGDCRGIKSAQVIAKAVDGWKKRGGNQAWSFTHAWKNVPRSAWGSVSVLASVESVADVKAAKAQGYAPAIVVPEHPSDKAFYLKGSKTKFIPCPAQTRNVGCTDCRLCFNADGLLARNAGIAFAAHGAGAAKAKRRLAVIK